MWEKRFASAAPPQPPRGSYVNVEDTRLYGMGPEDFPALLDVIHELAGKQAVFLDEIQELPEWQRLVRSLLDRGHPLCVTGSNASLLGREVGAKLTGRHRSFEVFPFSYSEYLAYTAGERSAATLSAYLDHGGSRVTCASVIRESSSSSCVTSWNVTSPSVIICGRRDT